MGSRPGTHAQVVAAIIHLTQWMAEPFLAAVAEYTARWVGWEAPRRSTIPSLMELSLPEPTCQGLWPPITPSPVVSPLPSACSSPHPGREICPIWQDRPVTLETNCEHLLCGACVEQVFSSRTDQTPGSCPFCRRSLTGWTVLPGVDPHDRQPDFEILWALRPETPEPEDEEDPFEVLSISSEDLGDLDSLLEDLEASEIYDPRNWPRYWMN